ncbi:MAG TPA: hypothetical protein PLV01_06880 [Candidatus Kapabacteria bacterium]|nr:hypothetical protein [Candidatus Kapabacteria bacterium]
MRGNILATRFFGSGEAWRRCSGIAAGYRRRGGGCRGCGCLAACEGEHL